MNATLEVFFDGECPLCKHEINWLRKRDRKQLVAFIDIAAADFEPESYGKTMEQLMGQLHARTPDGDWLVGVEVFRRMYGAVGLGFLASWTRWPVLRSIANATYAIFAKNRLRWTRRKTCDASGRCKV